MFEPGMCGRTHAPLLADAAARPPAHTRCQVIVDWTQRAEAYGVKQMRQLQTDEKLGKRARQKTAAGAAGKVPKGLVGGVASGTAALWTTELIPRCSAPAGRFADVQEQSSSCECSWAWCRHPQGDARDEAVREAA